MLKTCILTIASVIFFAALCPGASAEGVSGGQFLRIGVGAKTSALGESGAASSGAQSMFYNPAGLNDVKNTELSLSQVQWIADINYSNAVIAKKTGAGVWALAVNYLSAPPIASYDKFGNRLPADYSVADMVVALGYSWMPTPRTGLGLDLKYISGKLEADTAKAAALDAGFKYAAIPGALNLGFVAQNIGTRLKYINEGDSLPFNIKFGGQYVFRIDEANEAGKSVSIFTDFNHMSDAGLYANLGVDFTAEYSPGTSFAVRGGYKTNAADKGGGVSFGFGVDIKACTIDYSYSPMGDLGKAHRVSVTVRLDGKKDVKGQKQP